MSAISSDSLDTFDAPSLADLLEPMQAPGALITVPKYVSNRLFRGAKTLSLSEVGHPKLGVGSERN